MHVYGSMASGLGLAGADVDATVIVEGCAALSVLEKLAQELPRSDFMVLEKVYSARVPILRLSAVSVAPPVDFDLSVNNILPIYNTGLIKTYMDFEPRLAELVKRDLYACCMSRMSIHRFWYV